MFSKKIFCLMLSLSLITSCSWLRDKPKPQKTFDLGLSCLEVMPSQLQNLFAGRYTESAVDQESVKTLWSCLDESLKAFSTKTRGENPNYYTNSELLDFANRNLPNNNQFSKSLVDSIFMLKTSVLGGSNQSINQDEIRKLRGKLEDFGKIISPLAPYISTLLKPYESFSDDKRKIAGDRLNTFIIKFADLLGDSENTVTWQDLSSFVNELELYLKSPNPTSLTVVKEQIQLFQYLKILIVGGDESGIEKEKWHPIFKSISAIYNALYLTTSTTEMMEQLKIEIQSNDAEQKKATEKLTLILKTLKNDPTLYSKSTVQLFADRWSKALVLNAFLYPNSQNQLAVKSFLNSAILRQLSGSLVDEMAQVKNGDQSIELISKMAEHLSLLIEKSGTKSSALNIIGLRDYTSQLKELFADEKDYQILDASISILQDVSAILVGKNSGKLGANDFKLLIQKANDLYIAWRGEKTLDFNKALSASLAILTREPNASLITIPQIQGLLSKCEKLFKRMEITTSIDWAHLNKMVINGAKLKSVLFSNSNQNITSYELTQIYETWKAFNEKKEIDAALENLAKYFKNNPYSNVRIKDLMSALDAFLPEDQKLSQIGLTPDLVGSLKTFLIGGQSTILEKSEYVKMAQLGFSIFKNINPVLKTLPQNFKMGLNGSTFALLSAGIQGLIDDKSMVLSNIALKDLLLSQLTKAGIKIQAKTIDKLLIGLNFRVFDLSKEKKPKNYPSNFSSAKLQGFHDFFEKTKLDYLDFEKIFSSVDQTQALSGPTIFKKLTRSDPKRVLSSMHPIINGLTSMPYFTGDGKPQTNYYLTDLYYKSLIYHGLLWLFPAYETESKAQNLPRLNMNELVDLFDDINDAVYELGFSFSSESAKASAVKRMQSVNLFTRTGNGDDYMDVIETTDFLVTTIAGKNLLEEVRKSLVKDCYPQNTSYPTQRKFSYVCLKNAFFGKNQFNRYYQKVIPQMTNHYLSLDDAQREEFRKSTLTAVNANWDENSEMGLSDLETLASIPYYIENIFLRLDHDYNSMLTFTEAMSGFPVFCREIKKAAGSYISGSCEKGEDPGQIEAIYGHLLMKGTAPRSIEPGNSPWQKMIIVKNFYLWVYQWNRLDRDPEIRDHQPPYLYRKDLLNIISNLSTAIAPVESPFQP